MISKVTFSQAFEIIYTNTIILCVRTVRCLAWEKVTFEIIYTNTIILCVRTVRFLAREEVTFEIIYTNTIIISKVTSSRAKNRTVLTHNIIVLV
jgi:hypothetical protein